MKKRTSPYYLGLECAFLFGGLPIIFYFLGSQARGILFITLWLFAGWCYWILKQQGITRTQLFTFNARIKHHLLRSITLFAVSAIIMALYTAFTYPEWLFSFPKRNPMMWVVVICFYPILSALPQEIIYRSFFFVRYQPLFRHPTLIVLMSALFFSYSHILFKTPITLLFTFIGGLIFSITYKRTQSLMLVWIEHTLYGCFIFTIGLGKFFYTGAIQ